MHNVHSCVMGGSKWDSSKGLLFCFNDLLFHLVLKIRMEDLSRYFFFRRCTCWQSIPWVMIFNVLHHLQLSYWIFLFIIIMEFFIYLKNIFLQRCHTDVVHLVSVEREKKGMKEKIKMNKSWSVSKIRSTTCLQSFSHFDLMWLEIQMMSSAFFIQYQDFSRPIHLSINTANVCRFNFFFSFSLQFFHYQTCQTYISTIVFQYLIIGGTGKRRPFNFSPYTMLNGSLQLEGGCQDYTKN